MFAAVTSVALVGVEPRPVRVEAHVGGSRPVFHIVGLPDAAVREAKERVRAAISSSGLQFPNHRITVNLAPADLPKVGSAYDLPIALGILAASKVIPDEVVALGELALDGTVRPARGALGAGMVARSRNQRCLVAAESASEAAVVPDADVRGITTLSEAVAVANGEWEGGLVEPPACASAADPGVDLAHIRGQTEGRRALEIAAAGGHHLLLIGPPGNGKTMLARALPTVLPELTSGEMLEVAQAWSASGRSRPVAPIPPFRSPHHSATPAAIVGGGSGVPVPGELTLAHRGVLFLDELGEFPSHLLDTLRQPLEDGTVTVARKGASVVFPCAAQVVAATNPCPCGYLGDRLVACVCLPRALDRYRRRLSGPLVDRFDLRVRLDRVRPEELVAAGGEPSGPVRDRVAAARHRQSVRGMLNRDLDRPFLDALDWTGPAHRLLRQALGDSAVTARGYDRARRVAATIADLDASPMIEAEHVAEALRLRVDL